ncbi:hypothetical protein [Gulosibacter sp. 10]|uniref:hypothetical protein n=1 Tax=Gulosibacter sp. 10 TaxID=1255570 RepID=UPI00097EAD20|nr:hypothetical protein [Gulosibacter sp. 10]SJM64178.1 hypothetical protein FM112_09900 [Gulosibacter sp. 10]
MPARPSSRRADRRGLLLGLAFAAALLSPLRHYARPLDEVAERKFARDSFPLSTYPMFSVDRKGRVVVPHVIGVTAHGERVVPHYRHYGSGGLNQVRKQVARALRRGRAAEVAQRYADSLADSQARAAEAAGAASADEAAIVTVAVVRSRFVFEDYFAGRRLPDAESIRAECPVGGIAFAHPPSRLSKRAFA